MATLQQVEAAFLKADAAGDVQAATALAGEVRRLRAEAVKPVAAEQPRETTFGQDVAQGIGNLAAGAIRGAGSIGATWLAPVDVASDLMAGKGLTLESNRQRRAAMDQALQSLGADPSSLLYQGGKLGGEIAGTAGVGGILGGGARMAGAAPEAINALRTAGMTGGSMPVRIAGGAATGAGAAGLIDPAEAWKGAAAGGALPPALRGAGAIGQAAGRALRGPEVPQALGEAVTAARKAGYVIPPTQAKPSLGNRLLEGFSGKITTAQNASAKNQAVTNQMAARSLGLADDTRITPDVLKAVRTDAGQAYEAVRGAGTIAADKPYIAAIDKIGEEMQGAARSFPGLKKNDIVDLVETLKQPEFDAGDAIDAIRVLRDQADGLFARGEKGAAKAYKSASVALEGVLERHLSQVGDPDALNAFRNARTQIAKTYSVEKALNPTTGSVDARKLGAQIKRGKPLSGELRAAGEFANQFPKAAQAIEGMGSLPQTSPLDWALGAGMSASTMNPLFLASAAARPAARAAALSPFVQNRLAQQSGQPNALANLLANEQARQLLYRGAPAIAAD